MKRKRCLIYIYKGKSLGHEARVKKLTLYLQEACDIDIVSAGPAPVNIPEAQNCYQLPSSLHCAGLFRDQEELSNQYIRKYRLQEIIQLKTYDYLITEFFPFGRYRLKDEIIYLIDELKKQYPNIKIICSMRDILGQQETIRKKYYQQTKEILAKYYDLVWAHGPKFLVNTKFGLQDYAKNIIQYTGYLKPHYSFLSDTTPNTVGIISGGSHDAFRFIKATLDKEKSCEVLLGPFFDSQLKMSLEKCFPLSRFIQDQNLDSFLQTKKLVYSMSGYNSFTELIYFNIPTVFTPRTSEPEQAQRFSLLKKLQSYSQDELFCHKLSL